jgi:hypothetical protein
VVEHFCALHQVADAVHHITFHVLLLIDRAAASAAKAAALAFTRRQGLDDRLRDDHAVTPALLKGEPCGYGTLVVRAASRANCVRLIRQLDYLTGVSRRYNTALQEGCMHE